MSRMFISCDERQDTVVSLHLLVLKQNGGWDVCLSSFGHVDHVLILKQETNCYLQILCQLFQMRFNTQTAI